jgi:hypothetical protein
MTVLLVSLEFVLNHQVNAQKGFHQMVLKKQLMELIVLNVLEIKF